MTFPDFAIGCGWVAVVIGFWGTSSQLRKARRVGVDGISLATWLLFALVSGFWIIYGVIVQSWIVILGSAVMLPVQVAIVLRMAPWRSLPVVLRSCVFFAVCCVLPTFIWGWSGGVYGSSVVMVVNRIPQIVALVRKEHVHGVSAGAWFIAFLGASFWLIYYIHLQRWAAVDAVCITMFTNISIATLASLRHRARSSTSPGQYVVTATK